MPELRLTGCTSRPLIGYLKALGVLRVVGQQVDPSARGRWRNGVFELASELDRDGLDRFLRNSYAPAPVVSPWNGGSGFHPKDRQEKLRAIEGSTTERLEPYRQAIAAARQSLHESGLTDKPDAKQKAPLIRLLRRTAPDDALTWIDAAVVIRDEGLAYPPLLGSGGNDGRFDFSNNYAHCVVDCVLASNDDDHAASDLSAALWDLPAELERKLSLAHFSRDSSPNNSPYGEAASLGNPWDLILAVEGSLLLVAGAARRHGSRLRGSLVAPFTVRQTGAGYGSAVAGESGRAELWLPLWDGWASLAEISTLARESRAQVGGTRRRQAITGLDFARAAGELGVARGITAFERYAILERAGQSSLAVPTGRISVKARPGVDALRTIDLWLAPVLRFGGGDRCPRGPKTAIHRLETAVFDMAARGNEAEVCSVLEAIGAVETSLSRSGEAAGTMRPLTRVSAEHWIEAADDGSHEFAVAVAIASLRDLQSRVPTRQAPRERSRQLPALRDYLHGTQRGERGTEFDPERRRAVAGQDPVAILAALHARRHLDAARAQGHEELRADGSDRSSRRPQLEFARGVWVGLESAQLLAGERLDDRRILALLRGLALLDHTGTDPIPKPQLRWCPPQPAFELLALAWHPVPENGEDARTNKQSGDAVLLGARPGWAARLAAGATKSVIEDAALRLRMAGLPPLLDPSDLALNRESGLELGRRLAATLLLRLGPREIGRLTEAQIFKDETATTKQRTPR